MATTSKHFVSQAGSSPPEGPSPNISSPQEIPSSKKSGVSETKVPKGESSESYGFLVPSFSSSTNSSLLLKPKVEERSGNSNEDSRVDMDMETPGNASSELVLGSLTSADNLQASLQSQKSGKMLAKGSKEEEKKGAEFDKSCKYGRSDGGESDDSAKTILETSTKPGSKEEAPGAIVSETNRDDGNQHTAETSSREQHADNLGNPGASAAPSGEETSGSNDGVGTAESRDHRDHPARSTPTTTSDSTDQVERQHSPQAAPLPSTTGRNTGDEKHIDGERKCSINIAKLWTNKQFQIFKKIIIITDTLAVDEVLVLPNIDHDGVCCHDIYIKVTLKGKLLQNILDNVAAAEIVTMTMVKVMDGQTLDSTTHERRRFKNAHLNYCCTLIKTENLQTYQNKKLKVTIKFKLYPKDIEFPLNLVWDDETQAWLIN